MTIMINAFRDELRRKKISELVLGKRYAGDISEIDYLQVKENTDHETRLLIDEKITKLPFRQRTALILHYFNGLKIAEIAELMKIKQGTVKALIFQAIRKLGQKH